MCYKTQGHYKSSDLSRILNTHFGKSMNLARIKVMSMMICALCKVQQVAYTKLAAAFDNEAAASSSLRRIQRFIAECVIDTDLIAKLILKLIPVSFQHRGEDRTCKPLPAHRRPRFHRASWHRTSARASRRSPGVPSPRPAP